MRKNLPLLSMLAAFVLFNYNSYSQQAERFTYAITDVQQGTNNWSHLRKLDLTNGTYSDIILNGTDINFVAYDASSRRKLEVPVKDARYGQIANAPFGTGVAAAALDQRHSRLYYTPMFIDQLRYIDLRTMQVYYVTDQPFTGTAQKAPDQSNIVTRMVIADDGNGYAITNDGKQLIRFTTNKKMQITNMGTLVDDPANKGVSIHNSCSSYGGDMIADDEGNLYIFSARNHVFRVNIETKVATHLGAVTGLPAGFTINGAAVNDENKIIVGTASKATSYFVVDHQTLVATPYTINGTVLNSSDMANSNILAAKGKNNTGTIELLSRDTNGESGEGKINIYPNPVVNNQFSVQFKDLEAGTYTIQVTDVLGRNVVQQIMT
ncbi:MAG TPA: T9SS type A sorting domain-containing protein, partial [Chitinophagaceae bacterium]|nr:T9SS type A sorting domain-containing protein [Chitinophagaceae bacterium]